MERKVPHIEIRYSDVTGQWYGYITFPDGHSASTAHARNPVGAFAFAKNLLRRAKWSEWTISPLP